MRPVVKAALIAAALAGLAAVAARADDGTSCAVPAYLLTTDQPLSRVADAVKTARRLDVLVIGSGSSALNGSEGTAASYPARLEAALRDRLPGVSVAVKTEIKPKKTAAEAAESFAQLPATPRPALVVWQTGTVDAMRAVDPDDFRAGLDDGITALQKQFGADIILMNLQYNPRMETMLPVTPYVDIMRVVAQERGLAVFDRFGIMRHWNESGDFDLFGAAHGLGMAKRVHDCIGRSLATMIVDAAPLDPAELGVQR